MDQTIQCKDCGRDFVFTMGEQRFFKKLVEEGKMEEYTPPKRCVSCRKARKKN